MHQERQDDLWTLISLGQVCRKIRREVRRILFTCVRIPSVEHAEELISNRDGWARYVKSIIIDLNMFDLDDNATTRPRFTSPFAEHNQPISTPVTPAPSKKGKPRSCWAESALLTSLIHSLPSLNHLSFFADSSDDSTLALLFASLIPHPSTHAIPPTMLSQSPSALSTISGSSRHPFMPIAPLTHRLRSFGWRQRAAPPTAFRTFAQSSLFVSILHLIRHAHNLSFLVLDADMDEMTPSDIHTTVKELALRRPPVGEKAENVSLMLCGPIKGWEDGFLQGLVDTFDDIKELFVDRPLRKSKQAHATSFEAFTTLLRPLEALPHLSLLQVGSYTFTSDVQADIACHLSRTIPSLLVLGLLDEEGETNWWGIWRRASVRGLKHHSEGIYDEVYDTRLKALEDGDLKRLENEVEEWIKSHPPTPPSTAGGDNQGDCDDGRATGRHGDQSIAADIRMTPPLTQSPEVQPRDIDEEEVRGRARALGLDLHLGEDEAGSTLSDGRGGVVTEGQGRRMMSLDRLLQ
ncbi:hypothetical protein I317_07399 [Kwoniella heveanensis CBS 569]|nr:hypothetical protein I317_07399 [Kwoniella heveanensis CBS 569]